MQKTGERRLRTWLEQICVAVGDVATEHAFLPDNQNKATDGRRFWNWRRTGNWKSDEISSIFRVSRPTSLTVSFRVLLPVETGRLVDIDGWGLAWIAGRRKMSSYNLPELPAQSLQEDDMPASLVALREEILTDLKQHIGWFDELYATPEAALEKVMKPGRNGCRAGFPPVVDYLQRVIRLA